MPQEEAAPRAVSAPDLASPTDHLLLGPAHNDAVRPHRADAVHVPQTAGLRLDDVEHLLPKGAQELLGGLEPHALEPQARLDVEVAAEWFLKLTRLKADDIAAPKRDISGFLQPLVKAGIADAYLILSVPAFQRDGPLFVLPVEKGADGDMILAAVAEVVKQKPQDVGEVIRGAVVVGSPEARQRLKELKPTAHPAVGQAFAALPRLKLSGSKNFERLIVSAGKVEQLAKFHREIIARCHEL